MKRKVYQGAENIIVYGKISEAVSKISEDKQLMEKLTKESQMSAISEIMQKYKDEVFTILSLSIDGVEHFQLLCPLCLAKVRIQSIRATQHQREDDQHGHNGFHSPTSLAKQ